jgi:carbon-monoxide dehydrogenase medium subunit
MPLMNFRLARPAALIDLNAIASLAYIREDDGQIRFGAMTRQRAIEFSPVVRRRLPLLAEATALVGHLPIRTRGTIGGSIAHADPSAEYPAILTVLDGTVVARGPRGERVLTPGELFQGYLSTTLGPDEILVEVRLPAMPADAGFAFETAAAMALPSSASRDGGDYRRGQRCAAARLATAWAQGRCRSACGPPKSSSARGSRPPSGSSGRAAELVAPDSDLHASAAYRKNLTRVLTARALHRAVARIGGH